MNAFRFLFFFISLWLVSPCFHARAQEVVTTPQVAVHDTVEAVMLPTAYYAAVDSLVKLTSNDAKGTEAIIDAMLPDLREQHPEIPTEFFDELSVRLKRELNEKLSQAIADVYYQYFTLEEVREIIKFYQSPIGSKLAKTMPLMTPQLYERGSEIGRKTVEKFIDELSAFEV